MKDRILQGNKDVMCIIRKIETPVAAKLRGRAWDGDVVLGSCVGTVVLGRSAV